MGPFCGIGVATATAIGVAWEEFPQNSDLARSADLANNAYGRKLGLSLYNRRVAMSEDNLVMFAFGIAATIRSGNPQIQYVTG